MVVVSDNVPFASVYCKISLTNDCVEIDWEIVRDHDGDQQTAHLDTRYNLETHDGAVIYLRTTG